MGDPPDIDPCAHAIESRHWGTSSCHLVRHEDRYYAWLAGADGSPLVYPMASEAAARGFLDDWQATNVLHTRWDEMVVHIFLLDPGQGPQSADTPGRGGARIIITPRSSTSKATGYGWPATKTPRTAMMAATIAVFAWRPGSQISGLL